MKKSERRMRELIYLWTIVILAIAMGIMFGALTGCAQTHRETLALKCVDRPANQLLPGEVQRNSITAIDVSTLPVPFVSAPHRMVAWCNANGDLGVVPENANEQGMSALSDPLNSAINKFGFGWTL
jgi:hypothetical protein